jgi:HK97 family phage major capsid protein
MSKVVELRGKLDELRSQAGKVFEEAGEDYDFSKVKSIEGDDAAKAAQLRAWNDEMTALAKQIEEMDGHAAMKQRVDELGELEPHPGHGTKTKGEKKEEKTERKSLGQLFTESESYKSFRPTVQAQVASIEAPYLNLKATFDTAASTLTGYDRQPGIVLVGTQRLTVADLLAQGQTTQNTIRYVQEDTYTNAATAVAEGIAKPEASFDTSEVDAPVRKIAVTAKVTDEMFADFPIIRDYIDNRLRFMVAQTEEAQLLTGSGTAPNLRGILNIVGIQTQAKGTDTTPDAFYKAIIKVRAVGFFEPDGVVVHPNDWTDIRLLRTADGIYIWGAPMEAGPERIWGLPVVVTTAMTENTGLVGAFKLGAQVFYREGLRVESTNSNEDDFKKNLIAIRAEQREALAVYRPKAFCTVTGI